MLELESSMLKVLCTHPRAKALCILGNKNLFLSFAEMLMSTHTHKQQQKLRIFLPFEVDVVNTNYGI